MQANHFQLVHGIAWVNREYLELSWIAIACLVSIEGLSNGAVLLLVSPI